MSNEIQQQQRPDNEAVELECCVELELAKSIALGIVEPTAAGQRSAGDHHWRRRHHATGGRHWRPNSSGNGRKEADKNNGSNNNNNHGNLSSRVGKTTRTAKTPTTGARSMLARSQVLKRLLLFAACCCCWLSNQTEANMNLPDGIENILGFVPRSSFKCERDGYFGDIDNDCRLFHLCQSQVGPGGRVEWRHWTYACGNQTMFNQLTLTCAFVDEAIPCRHASQFQYLNEVIHKPAEPFLTDADVTSGFSYYSNRIMSDGARQRAFEDAHLLAQVGGGVVGLSPNSNQPKMSSIISQQAASAPTTTTTTSYSDQFRDSFAFANSLASNNIHHDQAPFQWPSVSNSQPRQHQPEVAVAATTTSPGPHHDRVDLIENHSFQFGNHLHAGLLADNGAVAPASSNKRQALFAPAPTPVSTTTAATTAPTTPTSFQSFNSNHNRLQAPQNSQFEYSITTNHRAGSPSELANVIVRNQQQQQKPESFGRQITQFSSVQTSSPTHPSSSTLTTTATSSSSNPTTEAANNSGPLQQPTRTPAPLVATFTNSDRLQPARVTTLVTPTTSTVATSAIASTSMAPTTIATSERHANNGTAVRATTPSDTLNQQPARQKRRHQSSGQQQQAGASRRANQDRAPRAGFQSSRLTSNNSGQQQQQQHKRQTQEHKQPKSVPIVMRKASSQSSGSPSTSAAGDRSSAASSQLESDSQPAIAWSGGTDFWRRSFDSQLMAPKFESLLLRRRV